MVKAGHYLINAMYLALENKGAVGAKGVLERLSERYTDDTELRKIYAEYRGYMTSGDPEKLDEIKASIRRLNIVRRVTAWGGTRLWFYGRRPTLMRLVRVT
jgi:hypothetical protein